MLNLYLRDCEINARVFNTGYFHFSFDVVIEEKDLEALTPFSVKILSKIANVC